MCIYINMPVRLFGGLTNCYDNVYNMKHGRCPLGLSVSPFACLNSRSLVPTICARVFPLSRLPNPALLLLPAGRIALIARACIIYNIGAGVSSPVGAAGRVFWNTFPTLLCRLFLQFSFALLVFLFPLSLSLSSLHLFTISQT